MRIDLANVFTNKGFSNIYSHVTIEGDKLSSSDGFSFYEETIQNLGFDGSFDPNDFLKVYDEAAEIKKDGKHLIVKSAKGRFKLVLCEESQRVKYPHIEGDSFKIKTKQFIEMCKNVLPFIPLKAMSPGLTGMNMWSKDGTLGVCGTDSVAMTEHKVVSTYHDFNIIIPVDFLKRVVKILPELGPDCDIIINDSHISIKCDEFRMGSALIQLNYVNYHPIIGSEISSSYTYESSDLIDAINTLMMYNKSEIEFSALGLSAKGFNGEGNIDLQPKMNGDTFNFKCNPRFLLRGLKFNDQVTILHEPGGRILKIDHGGGRLFAMAVIV